MAHGTNVKKYLPITIDTDKLKDTDTKGVETIRTETRGHNIIQNW